MLEKILIGVVYFVIIVWSIGAVLKEEAEKNKNGRKKWNLIKIELIK